MSSLSKLCLSLWQETRVFWCAHVFCSSWQAEVELGGAAQKVVALQKELKQDRLKLQRMQLDAKIDEALHRHLPYLERWRSLQVSDY